MGILKSIITKIVSNHRIKNVSNSDMYNTDIFKYGLINLLEGYKSNLISDNTKDTDFILKEIDFHLSILKKTINN